MSGPAVPTLFFAPQTCARVALTALAEIGLPFQTRVIAFLAGEHRQPAFLAINPSGKVPALQTSSGTVVQTGAILNYLAETWPAAGLLPIRASAIGRAQVQAQLFRCSSDLHPLVTRFVMAPMISTEPADAVRVRERAREVLTLQLAPLDALLSGQEWFLEEGWSILDAYLGWIWFRTTNSGFDATLFASIARHYERASDRPAARAALDHEARAQEELEQRGRCSGHLISTDLMIRQKRPRQGEEGCRLNL
jgi:glutathione S-transferase